MRDIYQNSCFTSSDPLKKICEYLFHIFPIKNKRVRKKGDILLRDYFFP